MLALSAITALRLRHSPDAGKARKRWRASVAASMVFDTMLSNCPLLPDVEMLPWRSYDEAALWQEAGDRVEAYRPDTDPLLQRIERYQASRAFSI